MKKSQFVVGLLILAVSIPLRVSASFDEEIRLALQSVIKEAGQSLGDAGLPDGLAVGVLPVTGDRGQLIESRLRTALSAAGMNVVAIREDPLWDRIWQEIEHSVRRDDILDPATLSQFGRLQGTQLLLYGSVRQADVSGDRVYVEIDLHLSEIETARYLWGGTFAHRDYLPGAVPVQGIVDINPAVRALLRDAMDQGVARLGASDKISGIATVAMVPLAGDIDSYVTSLVESMVTQTHLNPVDIGARSHAEALYLLRDQPQRADAVLVGAVRDLSRRLRGTWPWKNEYELNGEMQLRILTADTGEVLWSDTLAATGSETVSKTAWEVIQEYRNVLLIIAGVIVVLLILGSLKRAMTRVR